MNGNDLSQEIMGKVILFIAEHQESQPYIFENVMTLIADLWQVTAISYGDFTHFENLYQEVTTKMLGEIKKSAMEFRERSAQ